jgi:penicillin-binding protein 1C
VLESHPPGFVAWATQAGRPLVPQADSPRCPTASGSVRRGAPAIAFPFDGARFVIDPSLPREQQQIALRGASSDASLRFLLDGVPVATVTAPFIARWPLAPGEHVLVAQSAAGARSDPVRFLVR